MTFLSKNKDYLKLSIIFFIAQGWIVLNDLTFWDDWVWYNNPSGIDQGMLELGFGPAGEFLKFIYANPFGIHFSKFIIFSLYLVNGFVFRKTLDLFERFSDREKFFLAALFMMAPLNFTRHSLCVANNGLNLLLFYLGSYIALKNQVLEKKSLLILSLSLIFLSYFTNSFLPFTAILYLAMLYKLSEFNGPFNKNLLVIFLRKNYLYIISPLIFWIVKKLYFVPTGVYAQYNFISLPSIKLLVNGSFRVIKSAFLSPFAYTASFLPEVLIEVIIGCFILFMIFKYVKNVKNKKTSTIGKVGFGLLAFMVATLPYLLVGKVGSFNAYDSRHQLLQPLGFAFLTYYLVTSQEWTKRKTISALCFLLAFFSYVNFKISLEFQAVHFRQLAMMSEFKMNPIYSKNTVFLFEIPSEGPSNFFSKPSFYAFTGMFYEVFGEQTRIGASSRSHLKEAYEVIPDSHKATYKMKDVNEKNPEVLVNVFENGPLGAAKTIHLLLLSYTDAELFSKKINSLLSYKYTILKQTDTLK